MRLEACRWGTPEAESQKEKGAQVDANQFGVQPFFSASSCSELREGVFSAKLNILQIRKL